MDHIQIVDGLTGGGGGAGGAGSTWIIRTTRSSNCWWWWRSVDSSTNQLSKIKIAPTPNGGGLGGPIVKDMVWWWRWCLKVRLQQQRMAEVGQHQEMPVQDPLLVVEDHIQMVIWDWNENEVVAVEEVECQHLPISSIKVVADPVLLSSHTTYNYYFVLLCLTIKKIILDYLVLVVYSFTKSKHPWWWKLSRFSNDATDMVLHKIVMEIYGMDLVSILWQ